MAFLEGFATGLAFIVFLGPVFFTLLRSSLEHGFRSGFSVALGIFSSDVICVILLYGLGVTDLITDPQNQFYISLGGSAILIGLGIKYMISPVKKVATKEVDTKRGHYLNFFIRGFLVNFVNPFVFIVWMGVISLAGSRYAVGEGFLWFLTGTLISILCTDTAKAAFASFIKTLLNPVWLGWTYRVIGVILLGFGVRLLMFAVSGGSPEAMMSQGLVLGVGG
ncbi:MAG: LysE family translocator [Bacteroidota bacterium]